MKINEPMAYAEALHRAEASGSIRGSAVHGGPAIDFLRRNLVGASLCAPFLSRAAPPRGAHPVPMLAYHRFAPTARDGMTLRIATLEAHLRLIDRLDCTVIALADWVDWRRGLRAALPPRAVVLSADDGHRSQFEVLVPRLKERGWPLTLFIYPSAISNADYAMTWAQLREISAVSGVSVQSHSYWHPNFLRDRSRMAPQAFQRFAADQLKRSRATLQNRLGQPVTLLAWPFGLSDEGLRTQACECGYEAAFSLGNRSATRLDPLHDVPRHLMVDSVDERQLAARLEAAFARGAAT